MHIIAILYHSGPTIITSGILNGGQITSLRITRLRKPNSLTDSLDKHTQKLLAGKRHHQWVVPTTAMQSIIRRKIKSHYGRKKDVTINAIQTPEVEQDLEVMEAVRLLENPSSLTQVELEELVTKKLIAIGELAINRALQNKKGLVEQLRV